MDEEDRRHESVNIFARDGMPGEWQEYALELKEAADQQWRSQTNRLTTVYTEEVVVLNGTPSIQGRTRKVYSGSRIFMLLAGFATENLVKGLLVARNPTYVSSGELHPQLKSHKITKLLDQLAGIELDDYEEAFCKKAEEAIPYWGRYPIPLSYNRVVPDVGVTAQDRAAFLRLFSRLDKTLHQEIRDGWDSGVGAKSHGVYRREYDDEAHSRWLNQKVKAELSKPRIQEIIRDEAGNDQGQ
jgi:hypothetical protein